MAQTINTNVASLNAQRNLNNSQLSLNTSLQRLSSGLRVNSAKDDAAGLAIADRMNAQVRGMSAAVRNANDGISLAQTAEGALSSMGDIVQRMRELAVQAASDTASNDRASLDQEYQDLGAELTRITTSTEFNGTQIVGSATTLDFQIGANNSADNRISVTTVNMGAATGLTDLIAGDLLSKATAQAAMDDADVAINDIDSARSTWGSVQNRFQAAITNLDTAIENTSAARGRIMDADFAAESANMTRSQILQQAGTAMLAQANAVPQNVLTLLRG